MTDRIPVSEYFDGLYGQHDRYWWRGEGRLEVSPDAYPTSLLTQATLRAVGRQTTRGRALDLGAGEGTDAIRLARLGYEVDAVEISSVAAGKIKQFADEAGVKINVVVSSIQDFTPEGFYDVVICNGVLHYVEDKQRAISLMQQATTENGINVISLWSTYSPVPECHEIADVYCDDEDGTVVPGYRDWPKEIIYFERNKPETAHSDLPAHGHSHIKFVARKPAGA